MDRVKDIINAIAFAAEKHKNQRRKDTGSTPYINHPIGVMEYISRVGKIDDPDILMAAVLHDTVEDTDATIEEIEEKFGPTVKDYVAEVTDNKSLSQVERKKLQVINAPKKSDGAKIIKMADKLHNLTDLLNNPPPTWSPERVQGYFVWSWFVIQGCRGINHRLDNALEKVFKQTFIHKGVKYDVLPYKWNGYDETVMIFESNMIEALEKYYESLSS